MRPPIDLATWDLKPYGPGLTDAEEAHMRAELEALEDAWFRPGQNPERHWDRMLIHICCGPCATFPLHILKHYGGSFTGLFANPNIQPEAEWTRRLRYAQAVLGAEGIPLEVLGSSEETRWRSWADRPKSQHCGACYSMRMMQVAEYAAQRGFDSFATVLTVSPYQEYARLTAAGEIAAKRFGISYAALDWRPGYRVGQLMARRDRVYRQKYCGCIYSLGETRYTDKILTELGLSRAAVPARVQD